MNEKVSDILKRAGDTGGERLIADKGYGLTEEGKVVPLDHADAAFLLVGEGGSLPKALADELGVKAAKKKGSAEPAPAQPAGGVTITHEPSPVPVGTPQPAPPPPQQPAAAEPAEKKA